MKPHITLVKIGPKRGLWFCRSIHFQGFFGETPLEAYREWVFWQQESIKEVVTFLHAVKL